VRKLLSENTGISIGLVVILIGGAAWFTALWDSTKANSADLADVKMAREAEWKVIQGMNANINYIKGQIDEMRREQRR
jgi:hypothetical protein